MCGFLQVEAGLVLESPDQRFKFSYFSLCFCGSFSIMSAGCSMKYL
jgi:hypothetical protein